MEELSRLIGYEEELERLTRRLFDFAHRHDYDTVGAVRITCADETERECSEVFQRGFVEYLLPRLRIARHAPFALSNLGGRYEPGAMAIAEQHFAAVRDDGKRLMVVKINSHVAVDEDASGVRFGSFDRYGLPSTACGALLALLAGEPRLPAVVDLEEAFAADGVDRLAELADPELVPPADRPLVAAVCNCLLQARRAVAEIEATPSDGRTDFLVLAAVTVNRVDRDGELLCGVYWLDAPAGGDFERWCLPDRPSELRVTSERRPIAVGPAAGDGLAEGSEAGEGGGGGSSAGP